MELSMDMLAYNNSKPLCVRHSPFWSILLQSRSETFNNESKIVAFFASIVAVQNHLQQTTTKLNRCEGYMDIAFSSITCQIVCLCDLGAWWLHACATFISLGASPWFLWYYWLSTWIKLSDSIPWSSLSLRSWRYNILSLSLLLWLHCMLPNPYGERNAWSVQSLLHFQGLYSDFLQAKKISHVYIIVLSSY